MLVSTIGGVKGCHDIRSRGTVNSVYLGFHIFFDRNVSIERAHDIADIIEEKIEGQFPAIVDIIVHVEPEAS